MQITREQLQPTRTKLVVAADQAEINDIKQQVLEQMARQIKVQGFRTGKAPASLVEKQLDQSQLQSEFMQQAVNDLYIKAAQQEALRPTAEPQITINKFVPFTTFEFSVEVETVGKIKLADYKNVKLTSKPVEVTAKDVSQIVENLQSRAAQKKLVERAAKAGDEVIIDFEGVDSKTKEKIQGADGKEHPLTLGSQSFIPGFEEALTGLKPGGSKTFPLTFPADYGAKELQNKKVEFTVTVLKVNELAKPKVDDTFAATVGPFKTLAELKADIKKQLKAEKERETQQLYDNELLEELAKKSEVEIPNSLVESEIDRMEDEEKRNLVYRGQTWQEHLESEGVTADGHRDQKREAATLRIETGLLLGEVAETEKISVTPEELEIRIQLLKGQYQDAKMQAELEKPENRRDIANRLMTEKTIDKLRSYAKR